MNLRVRNGRKVSKYFCNIVQLVMHDVQLSGMLQCYLFIEIEIDETICLSPCLQRLGFG